MSYYADNPYERPENPRCLECDDRMTEKSSRWSLSDWECQNPDCPNCPESIVMDSLEALVEEIPPEPDVIGAVVDVAYGQADLGSPALWESIEEGEPPIQQAEPAPQVGSGIPEQLRESIASATEHHMRAKTPVAKDTPRILASQLDKIFGNKTDRYVVTAWLLNRPDGSSKTMKPAEVQTFLDWLGVKGFGDTPLEQAVTEARDVLAYANAERGQMEF